MCDNVFLPVVYRMYNRKVFEHMMKGEDVDIIDAGSKKSNERM